MGELLPAIKARVRDALGGKRRCGKKVRDGGRFWERAKGGKRWWSCGWGLAMVI